MSDLVNKLPSSLTYRPTKRYLYNLVPLLSRLIEQVNQKMISYLNDPMLYTYKVPYTPILLRYLYQIPTCDTKGLSKGSHFLNNGSLFLTTVVCQKSTVGESD